MLNLKKILPLCFLFILCINPSFVHAATPAPQPETPAVFTDLKTNHPYYPAIIYLNEQKVLQGYPNGSFLPDASINRAELLKVLLAGQGINPDQEIYKNCFPDVADQWFAKYICYAQTKKWVEGYPDGEFKPSKTINKVEALKMLMSTHQISVRDKEKNEPWYQPYEDKAEELLLLADIALSSDHFMTRGEIADAIVRIVVACRYGQRYTVELFEKFKQEVPNLSQLANIGKKILMIIPPKDFNDDEYFITKDLLKAAGFTIDATSSITGNAISSKGKKVYIRGKMNTVKVENYNAVIFIGGPGVTAFDQNQDYYNLASDAISYDLVFGAICLAPKVLATSGIFEGINVTAWDDEKAESKKVIEENGGIFSGKEIEVDGKIITANGPEQSNKFAEKINQLLQNYPQEEIINQTKLYQNNDYGFEFKYPDSWTIDKERSTANEVVFDIGIPESREAVSFNKNDKNLTLDQLKTANFPDDSIISKESEIKVDGEKALVIETTEFGMTYIIFNHQNFSFIITTGSRMITEGITSSWEFTK